MESQVPQPGLARARMAWALPAEAPEPATRPSPAQNATRPAVLKSPSRQAGMEAGPVHLEDISRKPPFRPLCQLLASPALGPSGRPLPLIPFLFGSNGPNPVSPRRQGEAGGGGPRRGVVWGESRRVTLGLGSGALWHPCSARTHLVSFPRGPTGVGASPRYSADPDGGAAPSRGHSRGHPASPRGTACSPPSG